MKREYRPPRPRRWSVPLVVIAAHLCIGWSGPTVHHVAWTAVDFFPSDLARQVRRHDDRFNAGIRRGLSAPPAWRAGPPGSLPRALEAQVRSCAADLRKPVPLADLVEEIGVLAVLVLDVNDPLAAIHDDPREASYAAAYQSYVNSVLGKLRLVYYGQNHDLIYQGAVTATIESALDRSNSLYPFIGQEFYRTGELRDWRVLDDRSVTFGVAGVSLSRGLTDLANIVAYVWRQGGGRVPTPRPTPLGHVGPTITRSLEGGFPKREAPGRGEPAMPRSSIRLPPP
jgi:hypothetical protein